jgi:hypothetical protein
MIPYKVKKMNENKRQPETRAFIVAESHDENLVSLGVPTSIRINFMGALKTKAR